MDECKSKGGFVTHDSKADNWCCDVVEENRHTSQTDRSSKRPATGRRPRPSNKKRKRSPSPRSNSEWEASEDEEAAEEEQERQELENYTREEKEAQLRKRRRTAATSSEEDAQQHPNYEEDDEEDEEDDEEGDESNTAETASDEIEGKHTTERVRTRGQQRQAVPLERENCVYQPREVVPDIDVPAEDIPDALSQHSFLAFVREPRETVRRTALYRFALDHRLRLASEVGPPRNAVMRRLLLENDFPYDFKDLGETEQLKLSDSKARCFLCTLPRYLRYEAFPVPGPASWFTMTEENRDRFGRGAPSSFRRLYVGADCKSRVAQAARLSRAMCEARVRYRELPSGATEEERSAAALRLLPEIRYILLVEPDATVEMAARYRHPELASDDDGDDSP